MIWIWVALALMGVALLAVVSLALFFHFCLVPHYLLHLVRNFQQAPLFKVPFGLPVDDAEHVILETTHGLKLHGCYLHARAPRKGVILFGLEFGSNRWACVPYCEFLLEAGYDIFSFETRGQGESPSQPDYVPMQWVTDYELDDFRVAMRYLKSRPDADPNGIGFFGVSKGAGAGLHIASEDNTIRCCVTDGVFGTRTTMVPYMAKFILIYSSRPWLARRVPNWYFAYALNIGLDMIRAERNCSFPHLEKVLGRISPRPWLSIHGGRDNYIRPEMARELFEYAGPNKELWIVPGAKHNQALNVANGDYKARVLDFFDQHLGKDSAQSSLLRQDTSSEVPQQSPRLVSTAAESVS